MIRTLAVREEMRVAVAKCEAIFRLEAHEGPSGSCLRALCRSRVVAEMHQRRGTQIAEHLKLVLSMLDRQQER